MTAFELHSQLAADCHVVGDLPLCRVLLLDDSRYPWVVLVPRVAEVREVYQLAHDQRTALLDESCRVGAWLMARFDGEKLNVGALGNLVPQLHVHHVVRHAGDPAWPGPVWGHSAPVPYGPSACAELLAELRSGLATESVGFGHGVG